MTMLQDDLQGVFRKVFSDRAGDQRRMRAGDNEQWDSLANINLIVEVEKTFAVKFRNAEIARLRCIGKGLKKLLVRASPELAPGTGSCFGNLGAHVCHWLCQCFCGAGRWRRLA